MAAPLIGDEEISAVEQVLRSGMLAQGPRAAELEEAFAAYCGTKYAVAVNSGTAALHSALFAAGIGPGDEVITTPFSFIATANPILFLGAKPVFVDIDAQTFNINVELIEAAITPKTKAIIPVYLYGQPCDQTTLKRIAAKHNLVIIEDACQAVGAAYEGVKTGGLGDLGCFSLYATKNIMCGEGGIVTTNDEAYAATLRRFRQHGMSGPYEYAHIGYNYRITDLLASIAVEQLKKVERFTEVRQRNALQLSQELAGVRGIILPTVAENRTHVYHQYTLRITEAFGLSRDEMMEKLKEKGIGTGLFYPKPLYSYAHIAAVSASNACPEAEKACKEVLSLPVHPGVTTQDITRITQAIKELV